MDILGSLLQGALGGGQQQDSAPQIDVGGLASQFGLTPEQANSAVGALLPAVLGGLKNTESSGGLGDLAAIANTMGAPHEDVDSGNSILGQIFGSKDVSRQVATHASAQTGISDTILKAMLPIIASLVAQQVAKKMGGGVMGGLAGSVLGSMLGGGAAQAAPAGGGGLGGMLGGLAGMLDANHDGNPLDDILGSLANR
ncbi:MAG: hypothetical protein RL367_1333 [Pseudomonadota bacterium]|jgi:hypothetical protein